jgi:signal transduction histidine kinase
MGVTPSVVDPDDRLQVVFRQLSEPLILVDPNDESASLNPAACRLLGLEERSGRQPIDEFVRTVEWQNLAGTPLALADLPVVRALRGEMFFDQNLRVRRGGAGSEWIGAFSSQPVRDDRGKLILSILSVRSLAADQHAAEEMRKARSSIRQLSGELLRLQDEERKRIARELHDGTVQILSGLVMNLSQLQQSPSIAATDRERQLVAEGLTWAKQAVGELRNLSYLLHPPSLDELGLTAALRSWIDGFSERTGISADVDLEDPGRLPGEMETTLFRIAQEALSNVHRHSGSPTVAIRLKAGKRNVRLEVEDAGRGVPRTVVQQNGGQRLGVGILGMRERARQLGGLLEIRCSSQGTTVSVTLPRRGTP